MSTDLVHHLTLSRAVKWPLFSLLCFLAPEGGSLFNYPFGADEANVKSVHFEHIRNPSNWPSWSVCFCEMISDRVETLQSPMMFSEVTSWQHESTSSSLEMKTTWLKISHPWKGRNVPGYASGSGIWPPRL